MVVKGYIIYSLSNFKVASYQALTLFSIKAGNGPGDEANFKALHMESFMYVCNSDQFSE